MDFNDFPDFPPLTGKSGIHPSLCSSIVTLFMPHSTQAPAKSWGMYTYHPQLSKKWPKSRPPTWEGFCKLTQPPPRETD